MQQNTIWIAYSGGVDSTVLMHIASKHYDNIHAVHINHGLNANACMWERHCASEAKKLGVPFTSLKVNAQPISGQSPEEAARNARYSAFKRLVADNDVLLTAHHADDQAETVLYRLLRGTGPKGLGAMQPKTINQGIKILRPMLDIKRDEILEYAKSENLSWIEDCSNNNQDFDRNFIRQRIMPLLKQRWSAVTNINRAAGLCAELHTNIATEDVLDLKFWQRETIRAWLHKHKLQPTLQQLNTILTEVVNARSDAQPRFVLGNKIICRSQNKLYVISKDCAARKSTHGRPAKKIFQQFGIPPWERDNYKVIYQDGRLIEIVGLWRAG